VARHNGAFEDLLRAASRLPWPFSLLLAPISAALLHLLATVPAAPAAVLPSDIVAVSARSLLRTFGSLFEWIVPLVFLFAAILSFSRRSQAVTLFEESRDNARRRIKEMTWGQFERLIGELFRRRGYGVSEIGGPHADGGVDLVLTRDTQRILVQCKHWRARKVGVSVIRELQGVIAAEGANGGYVVTSGEFTGEARRFAESCRLELVDGDRLSALIQEVGLKSETFSLQTETDTRAAAVAEETLCPACGSAMIKRVAKRGRYAGDSFWGCSQYPACRGTRLIK
jgi:restriction system protein